MAVGLRLGSAIGLRTVRLPALWRRHRAHARTGVGSRSSPSARCRAAPWCKRAGAKPGDRIVVTGTIGDAALGLRLLREPGLMLAMDRSATTRHDISVDRYRVPQPRSAMAESGARLGVGSDGYIGRTCRRSRQSCVRCREYRRGSKPTRYRCRPAARRRFAAARA